MSSSTTERQTKGSYTIIFQHVQNVLVNEETTGDFIMYISVSGNNSISRFVIFCGERSSTAAFLPVYRVSE